MPQSNVIANVQEKKINLVSNPRRSALCSHGKVLAGLDVETVHVNVVKESPHERLSFSRRIVLFFKGSTRRREPQVYCRYSMDRISPIQIDPRVKIR